jgi:hypothetical protein
MTDWLPISECPACGAPLWVDRAELDDEDRKEPPVPHYTCECRNKIPATTIIWQAPSQPTIRPYPTTTPWYGPYYYSTNTTSGRIQ